MLFCPYLYLLLLLLLALSVDEEDDEERTLAPQPLRRNPVVLVFDKVFDVVLMTLALSVVLVSSVILPAVILILFLVITIFSVVLGFAALSFILTLLLSPLFTVAALFSCSLHVDLRIGEVVTRQTEGQRARLRAGDRQDHQVARERGAKPIWSRLLCF